MKVGLFQYNISWENKGDNKSKILSILKSSNAVDLDWLIFPEMTLTGFSMDTNKTELVDDDIAFFKNLARQYGCNVSFGGVLKSNNRLITVSSNGEVVNEYSKIHLFGYGDETSHYSAGKDHKSFKIDEFKVLPTICYDLRFSYLFWNNAQGTDLSFVIANWPASRRIHWVTLLKARAIENQCYMIGVNRTGNDPELSYAGDSMVIDPQGNELLNCIDKEGLFVVKINREEVSNTRELFPFIKDRHK